jgi:RNA polymerase sigma-70 factor (ECF subfamily)
VELGRSGTPDDGPRGTSGRWAIGGDPGALGPASDHRDERAIVAAVLDGDRDAFRRLVERESAAVIRACHRILGDHAEAEDAAQEAFVTAYRSLATWRSEGPFGAWLTRIAVRIALRQVGRRRTVTWRDPVKGGADDSMPSAADRASDRASVAAAAWHDPALLSMRSERATEIRRAVAALPEPYREVVALRFFGEASLEEIARQTGRPLGTVKTHLHRGLARLRAQMEGFER